MNWEPVSARELRRLEREAEEALQPKQVAFCRALALEGLKVRDAYEAAGYESKRPDVQAAKLQRREDVQRLLAIYAETARRKALVNAKTLQLHIWDIMEKTLDGEDFGNSLRAAELLAKMSGNMVERKEIKHEGNNQPIPQMDTETLREAFKAKRRLELVKNGTDD